jgi:hypothetical protein
MKFLHITSANKHELQNSVNKYITSGKHVFLFIHYEKCHYCTEALPIWKQLEGLLSHIKRDDVLVADININTSSELSSDIKKIGKIEGFPTIKYIHGEKTEEYKKERTTEFFMNWIETNIGHAVSSKSYTSKMRKQRGGYHKRSARKRSTYKNKKRRT